MNYCKPLFIFLLLLISACNGSGRSYDEVISNETDLTEELDSANERISELEAEIEMLQEQVDSSDYAIYSIESSLDDIESDTEDDDILSYVDDARIEIQRL